MKKKLYVQKLSTATDQVPFCNDYDKLVMILIWKIFTFRVDGKTLLDQFFRRHSATEDDVAFVISELCEILNFLHQQNIVHLDLRVSSFIIYFEG